jgi:GNAT superfamily N-acetyltransferase
VGTDVRPCGYDDVRTLGASLARAFRDDPVFRYLVPDVDDDERARRLTPFFAATVGFSRSRGEAWTNDDGTAGALWRGPGVHIPQWRQLGAGFAFLRAAARHVPKGLRLLNAIEREHPKEPEHWYLSVLGTAPEQQGKGFGGALLAPILQRCDTAGIPAYLESSKEANLAFYGRFGFRVVRELVPVPGGPTLWPMWRDPQ